MIEINKIHNMDCLSGLKTLADKSVNMCVTSPPYYGLRDYGVSGQLGLEQSPDVFVQKLVDVFRQVKRVLRDDGTLWLNLGDSYAGSNKGFGNDPKRKKFTRQNEESLPGVCPKIPGLKSKDLIGIPWRVAFALQADGWYLRQDIIWHKTNPMPESVKDRCTKAHEYIFLLSKSPKYYYDTDSVRQPYAEKTKTSWGCKFKGREDGTGLLMAGNMAASIETHKPHEKGSNRRSVWAISTKPFKGAHFATFPPDLIEPCILAGCPENGVVVDPFMGAGTTALVSIKNNRNFIGFELNDSYCEIANTRITQALYRA